MTDLEQRLRSLRTPTDPLPAPAGGDEPARPGRGDTRRVAAYRAAAAAAIVIVLLVAVVVARARPRHHLDGRPRAGGERPQVVVLAPVGPATGEQLQSGHRRAAPAVGAGVPGGVRTEVVGATIHVDLDTPVDQRHAVELAAQDEPVLVRPVLDETALTAGPAGTRPAPAATGDPGTRVVLTDVSGQRGFVLGPALSGPVTLAGATAERDPGSGEWEVVPTFAGADVTRSSRRCAAARRRSRPPRRRRPSLRWTRAPPARGASWRSPSGAGCCPRSPRPPASTRPTCTCTA